MQILEWTYYGNSVRTWTFALLIAAILFLTLRALHGLIFRQLQRRKIKHQTGSNEDVSDTVGLAVIRQTRPLFLLIIAAFFATRFLYVPEELARAARSIVVLALVIQAGLWGSAVIAQLLEHAATRRGRTDPSAKTTLGFVASAARFILWSLLVLLALQNAFELDITTLIAGLGVGGIAIALAVQKVLGDLFASLSIVLDKPFVVGDFIVVGEASGTVENIGLKTTRVRSLYGEQIVFANADLLESRVRNYQRLQERCIIFDFKVPLSTPPAKLATIPELVEDVIEAEENARFGRAHFATIDESAMRFEVLYHVLDASYDVYMDVQQEINLGIIKHLDAIGVELARPARTIHVHEATTPPAHPARSATSPAKEETTTKTVATPNP